MDIFEYKGRNKRGEVMQGTIESPNQEVVAAWPKPDKRLR